MLCFYILLSFHYAGILYPVVLLEYKDTDAGKPLLYYHHTLQQKTSSFEKADTFFALELFSLPLDHLQTFF